MSPYRPMTGYAPVAYRAALRSDPGFQLADLIALASARRTLILRVALGTIILAVLVALSMPTTYSSSAVVMLDQRKNNITDVSAVLAQMTGDPATLQNQIQLLTSRQLAGKVIQQLELQNDPEFNPLRARPGFIDLAGEMVALLNPKNWFDNGDALIDEQALSDRIVENFLKHVTAEANGLSTAVTLTVKSRDPQKAARIANAMAALYLNDQVAVKRDAADATTGWLNQRIQELSQQLQLQEGAVQTYKAEHGLTDTAPGSSLVDQQLVGINSQIVEARSDLAAKQALADRIRSLVQAGNAADVSSVVSSPLIVQLRTQAAQLQSEESDLSSKYGPLHPKLVALQQQKRDLDIKITEEVRRIAGAAGNDAMVAQAHLRSLEGSLGGARSQFTGENYARVQLQALESNAASTRAQYEAFVTRLRQTQDQDAIQLPESRIISPAPIPRTPSGPKRSLIVGASIPLGLLLGLLAALLTEKFGHLWPSRVRTAPRAILMPPPAFRTNAMPRAAQPRRKPRPAPVPLPAWNGPPILAEIADSASLKAGDYVLDFPKSAYSHSMAALARQLESQSADGKDGAAIVVVTSAEAGDNKSAIGVSLARAAALLGKKALLIDCDPAQTATATMHAAPKTGLYDVLTGTVPLNQAFAKDPRTNAYVLAMTKRPPNLATMFNSSQMTRLIGILRGGCDLVVVDCAKAIPGSETAVLARLADATLLVAREGALYAPSLAKTVTLLNDAQAAPIGIVVTK